MPVIYRFSDFKRTGILSDSHIPCINDFHFITDNPWQSAGKEIDITFKIRHTPEFTKGKLVQEGERQFRILSSEKLQGIAPGQFGVVYDEAAQVCVGSGEIG